MSRLPSLLAACAAALGLGGCVAGPPVAFDSAGPPFVPERYFAGRTYSWGVVESTHGGPAAQFQGSTTGRREADGTLAFEQNTTYADGAKVSRAWRLRRLDANRIEATSADVSGVATGEVGGRMMHLRYALTSAAGARSAGLDVEHWMYLQDDGVTVLNRSVIRRGGAVVQMATERLVRAEDPRPTAAKPVLRSTVARIEPARIEPARRSTPRVDVVSTGTVPAASAIVAEAPRAPVRAAAARDEFWSSFDLRR